MKKIEEKIRYWRSSEAINLWDVLILTIIMFGGAIYNSNMIFFSKIEEAVTEYGAEFSRADHLMIISSEITILCIVFFYLKIRQFQIKRWNITVDVKAVAGGIFLFLILALGMDLFMAILGFLKGENTIVSYGMGVWEYLSMVSLFEILSSVVNGFFEELYFIGICLLVERKYRFGVFLFSLFVRFSFHTYQGWLPALGYPVVMGIIYYIVYTKSKSKNLVPFFLSHMIAVVLGLGILGYIV
ncbi:MAG: CPBP family intramembrane metalloprotease [Lachnospiraceae bacterium]|nr:CPBP family intramembrane metalloprotease [Lachnospiraceae bacterium]